MRRALVMFTALSVVLVSVCACVEASPPQASSASGQAVWTWNEIGRAQAAGKRPVTAIREADTDGNPSTTADAVGMALRATPPLGCKIGQFAIGHFLRLLPNDEEGP